MFSAKVRLGLTATFRRSDGRIGVIESHIGGVIHRMNAKTLPVTVYFVKIGTMIPLVNFTNKWNNEINWGRLITQLAENEPRNTIIAQSILRALNMGRTVLVLSERLNQLKFLAALVTEGGVSEENIGFFIGGKKEKDLDIAATKPLILATYQMARDSLDIPRIDTLFLGTPVADIEQSVGRIVRPLAGKKGPVVVDFVDKLLGICIGLAKAREKQYKRLDYKIG
jgi:superfamily II DNA or RNA helicase